MKLVKIKYGIGVNQHGHKFPFVGLFYKTMITILFTPNDDDEIDDTPSKICKMEECNEWFREYVEQWKNQ